MLGVACYRMLWGCNLSWGWRDILTLSGSETTTPPVCPSSTGYARHCSSAGQFLSRSCYLPHCFRQVLHPSSLLPLQLLLQFRLCTLLLPLRSLPPQAEVNRVPVEPFTGFAAPRRPKSLQIQREVYCHFIIIGPTALAGPWPPPLTVI